MTPARWQQIEELYQAAIDSDPDRRPAILARADPEVRLAVEKMLAQPGADSPLDSPAWEGMEGLEGPAGPSPPQPAIGSQLGPYRIEALIGSGGMGAVYRAIDTRLGRAVAIKIPTRPFDGRFEREARTIAALNHPNICTIHDVGSNFLVMELVDGATLEERIGKGPVPLEEAMIIARQIAEALDAAHEKGIIHRDLKPGNIKITPEGVIKVLDFGSARIASTGTDAPASSAVTETGVIVGTPSYMAPEHALGKAVDKRADIWALGAIVHEMITGNRLFSGATTAEILRAVLTQEPDWKQVPPGARPLLKRCLEKDPKHRLRDVGDAQFVLEQPQAALTTPLRFWWIAAAALAVGFVGSWAVRFHETPGYEHALSLQIDPPEGSQFMLGPNAGGISLSPDGKTAAFVATTAGATALWVRPLDGAPARLIPGTEGAAYPFFSPDSKSIAFFAPGKMQRVDLAGGAPLTICVVPLGGRGGTWTGNGLILFGNAESSIFQVPASGGEPTPLTTLDTTRGEVFHYWPQLLPNGKFLYFVRSNTSGKTGVYAASFAKPREPVQLLTTDTNALFVPVRGDQGLLLWLRGETLLAQDFDAAALKLNGEPHSIASPVARVGLHGQMSVAVSSTGLLLYSPSASLKQLTWIDRSGKHLGTVGEPAETGYFRLAPDARHIILNRVSMGGADLWMVDTDRGVATLFTSRPGISNEPVWSPDGRTILFSSGPPFGLFLKDASGAGAERRVNPSPNTQFPSDWSHDGRFILYEEETESGNHHSLWFLPTKPSDAKPRPYLPAPFNQYFARFSPDARWIAFQSDESGRYEVYVDAFPESRGKVRISTGGGTVPKWSANGRELFYVSADSKVMSVSLKVESGSLAPSAPHELFPVHVFDADLSSYDPAPDGQRFLVLESAEHSTPPLTVIVKWPNLLTKTPNPQ